MLTTVSEGCIYGRPWAQCTHFSIHFPTKLILCQMQITFLVVLEVVFSVLLMISNIKGLWLSGETDAHSNSMIFVDFFFFQSAVCEGKGKVWLPGATKLLF